MDIRQLRYFVEVVRHGYNLTETARRIHLTQPALSQSIRRLEGEFGVDLFERSHGQYQGLSSVGESVYHDAQRVLSVYDQLLANMQDAAAHLSGRIRLGIPPLILSVLLTDVLTEILTRFPRIRLEIVEAGAFDLRKMLQTEDLDAAILLTPTDLSPSTFREVPLFRDELAAFLSSRHPLAKEESLSWAQLKSERFVLFDESYMIHHNLMRRFQSQNSDIHIAMASKSWDFLLEAVRHSQFVTILPAPIADHYNLEDLKRIPIERPLRWEVVLVYPEKKQYSRSESVIFKEIERHFEGRL